MAVPRGSSIIYLLIKCKYSNRLVALMSAERGVIRGRRVILLTSDSMEKLAAFAHKLDLILWRNREKAQKQHRVWHASIS